jgi:hypothetical protein
LRAATKTLWGYLAQGALVVGEVAGGEGFDPSPVFPVERRDHVRATAPTGGFGRVEEQPQMVGKLLDCIGRLPCGRRTGSPGTALSDLDQAVSGGEEQGLNSRVNA